MPNYILSKTTFIKGLQCLKYLYLYKKHYTLRDKLSPEKLSKFKRGHNVGDLAQLLFPGGVNLKPNSHFQYQKAVENTQKNIDLNQDVIYEASFMYDGVLIFLDVFVNLNGKFYAYEVKSSLDISDTYLNDAALQYYVMRGCGIEIEDIFIVTLNKDYVRKDSININQLFNIKSVLHEVVDLQEEVAINIRKQKDTLEQNHIPEIDVGRHCYKPYDCDFLGFCWKNIFKAPSIFNLTGLSLEQKFDLKEKGQDEFTQIMNSSDANDMLKVQINCVLNKTEFVNTKAMTGFFSEISQNHCFLQFYMIKPALPLFENNKPYEPYPFLFSILPHNEGEYKPFVYLCKGNLDSRSELISFLIKETDKYETIVVYDKPYIVDSLIKTTASIGFDYELLKPFCNKLKGLKDVFVDNFYYSYKLNNVDKLENVLISLALKSPFLKKGRVNNIYEAGDLFLSYVESDVLNEQLQKKEELTDFGVESLKYLKRLFDFFQVKFKRK